MGYVFDFKDALACEHGTPAGRLPFDSGLEERLMLEMVGPRPGESVLVRPGLV